MMAQSHPPNARRNVSSSTPFRPLEWLDANDVSEGGRVKLDLPEMGAEGDFHVIAVEACPDVQEGEGQPVTGWFRHRKAATWNLWVEGEHEPIGTTALHPFWSVDREEWLPAGELVPGERLAVTGGVASFVRLSPRGDETVFNLEVAGDHCYRVGKRGTLVHNVSDPCSMRNLTPGNAHWLRTASMTFVDRRDYTNTDSTKCITPCGVNPKTDNAILVTEAFALVDPKHSRIGMGSGTGIPERRWSRCLVGKDTDDAGHVIGDKSLGGSGKLSGMNLFPQTARPANRDDQRTREGRIANEALPQTDEP